MAATFAPAPSFSASSSSSSSPNTAPTFTWSDLHTVHCSSTVGCPPHSVPSIISTIALEGGKQGCSASHLRRIVHRHTVQSADKLQQPLDMRVMEYWWQHIRQHKDIALYHRTTDTAAPTASSPSQSTQSATALDGQGNKPSKQGYRRKAELQQTRTVELTDDGVLLPPFDRHPLPAASLALSFAATVQQYPSLAAVASSTLRRTLLGLPAGSTAAVVDDERDGSAAANNTYCALETLGKAGVYGLWQQQLGGLLDLTANNMHPLLLNVRLRQQITERVDRGKNRVWLSGWQDRADRDATVRREQEQLCEQWHMEQPRLKRRQKTERDTLERWDKWRSAASQSPPHFYTPVDLQRERDDGDGDAEPFVDELQHSTIAATDACPANLSVSDYIYRTIRQSPAGLQMDDLRQLLPGQPMKALQRLIPALGESVQLLSVPDRKGRTLSYRFMTKEQYELIKQEEEGGSVREEKTDSSEAEQQARHQSVERAMAVEEDEESKAEAMDRQQQRQSVMPQATAPLPWKITAKRKKQVKFADTSAAAGEEQKEENTTAQLAIASPAPPLAFPTATASPTPVIAVAASAAKADRSVPLIVMQRRRAVLSLLTSAPSQLLILHSINRSLTVSHPPAMDKKTASRFYDAMQCDGLITLYTFMFPRQTGRGSHQVTVAGLRVKGTAGTDESGEYEYERKRLAHEFALAYLGDSGVRQKTEDEEEWDATMELARPAAVRSHSKKVKVEPILSSDDDSAERLKQPRDDDEEETEESGAGDATEADGQRRRDNVVEVSRLLLGFMAPLFPRAHYLHRLLWSVYQQPPLAVVKERSLPLSASPVLCFDYADVARRMRLSDFLLLCGAVAADCSTLSFLTDQSLLDRSLDDLPESVRSLLTPRSVTGKGPYRQLVAELDTLMRLRLIQPLAADDSHSTALQSVYSLSPSFTSGMQIFHFSSLTQLEAYWSELRALTTADKLLSPRLATWHLPASFIQRLRNKRTWRYLVVRTDSQCAQLDQFAMDDAAASTDSSSAARVALLEVRQIERAARVVGLKLSATATYYARRLLPQLAAVHDELHAYEEKLAAESSKARTKVKKEPIGEEDRQTQKRPRKKRKLPVQRIVDSDDEMLRDEQDDDRPVDDEKEETGATAARTRLPRGTWNTAFTTDEDERLITLYNSWLDKRAVEPDGYLPFTFTAPPHVDTALDDGLAVRFPLPSSSSMSVYAASFNTFLPLLSSDGPVVRQPAVDAGMARSGPLQDEEKSTAAATGLSESELRRRTEYVLHDTPMTEQQQHGEATADSDAEHDEEPTHSTQAVHEPDDVEITHMQGGTSRVSVLGAFCAFASTKLRNRNARTIRHQLERAITRLTLPLASTATASSVSTTGQRLLTATPHITAYVAADPVTSSLLAILKRIVLQPKESYQATVAHAMTEAYSEEQVSGLLAAMKSDRWITRRKNARGGGRSWKMGKRALELLYCDKLEQHIAQKQVMKQLWTGTELGETSRLSTPLSQLQVEAVMEGLDTSDVRLPLPRAERSEGKVESSEPFRVEGEAEEQKSGNVAKDAVVEAAERAAQWDFEGDSVSLVNTHWRLSEQPSAAQQHDSDQSRGEVSEATEEEPEPADTLLVRLLDEDEDEAMEQQEEVDDVDSEQQLCDQLIDALITAGPAGLTRKQLQQTVTSAGEVDVWADGRFDFAVRPLLASPVDRALQCGLLYGSIVALPSFDQQRFAADKFTHFHAPVDKRQAATAHDEDQQWATQCRAAVSSSSSLQPAASSYPSRPLVSHSWRELSGAVNQPLLSSLYSFILDSVRRWPGLTEQRLCALLPVLTVAEVRHVLQLLVLDDKVHARWLVSEVQEQGESGKRLERVACYFPVAQQL